MKRTRSGRTTLTRAQARTLKTVLGQGGVLVTASRASSWRAALERRSDELIHATGFLGAISLVAFFVWTAEVTPADFSELHFETLLALVPPVLPLAITMLAYQLRRVRARGDVMVGRSVVGAHHSLRRSLMRISALDPSPARDDLFEACARAATGVAALGPVLRSALHDAHGAADVTAEVAVHERALVDTASDFEAAVTDLEAAEREQRELLRVRPDLSAAADLVAELRASSSSQRATAQDLHHVRKEAFAELVRVAPAPERNLHHWA